MSTSRVLSTPKLKMAAFRCNRNILMRKDLKTRTDDCNWIQKTLTLN